MWSKTKLTRLLNIQYPIIQAPMAGGATTPELVAAISNAGGLGSLGAGYMPPEDIRKAIAAIRKLTSKPFAVNLFIPEKFTVDEKANLTMLEVLSKVAAELNFKPKLPTHYSQDFSRQIEIILEEKVPVFSFTFGIPDEHWIKLLKQQQIMLAGTATTVAEAKMLAAKDIDIIVAQGKEAGGHRGTFIGSPEDALVPIAELSKQLLAQFSLPIIASGGIMQSQDIFQHLSQGAAGVQLGTAFLSCTESGANANYKKTLLTATPHCTTLTRAFSGKFARGIKNIFIERMEEYQELILNYPVQNALTTEMRKESAKQNNINFMSLWAGENVHLSTGLSATELFQKYIDAIERLHAKPLVN